MTFDPFAPIASRRLDIEQAIDSAVEKDPGAWRQTVARVLETMDDWRRGNEPERSHLGGSVVGVGCGTRVALDYRKASVDKPNGRLIRLFNRGHMEEARLVAALTVAGIKCKTVSKHGGQISYELQGVRGSVDGVARLPDGRLAVLEFKTMSQRPFDELCRTGIIKDQHMTQMQCGMAGLGLDAALYVACHKDTDTIIVFEVAADPSIASEADDLAFEVVHGVIPEIEFQRGALQCKYCPHKAICHGGEAPVARCETCVHAVSDGNGRWSCSVANFGQLCDSYGPIQVTRSAL